MGEGPVIDAYDAVAPLSLAGWDAAIRGYATKGLFHESAWLRFLERSQRAELHAIRLRGARGAVLGYVCAAAVRKGPFRLLGSPLQGWTTNFMGPLVDDVDGPSLLATLDRWCRALRADYIELCHPALPPALMRGAGWELDADITFLVTVDDERRMWDRLTSECRNRIRRGVKHGLRVERTTDPGFVGQYHQQLQDVFLRQGRVPTYGEARVRALWDSLMPAGRLLALRVLHGDRVVATGVFPHDERAIYFWGGASWTSAYPLCPNELLHWHAMLFALERGIPTYNMSGGGSFKPKFGGRQVAVERWFKASSPWSRLGRVAFGRYVRTRQRVLGGLRRVFGPRPAPEVART